MSDFSISVFRSCRDSCHDSSKTYWRPWHSGPDANRVRLHARSATHYERSPARCQHSARSSSPWSVGSPVDVVAGSAFPPQWVVLRLQLSHRTMDRPRQQLRIAGDGGIRVVRPGHRPMSAGFRVEAKPDLRLALGESLGNQARLGLMTRRTCVLLVGIVYAFRGFNMNICIYIYCAVSY